MRAKPLVMENEEILRQGAVIDTDYICIILSKFDSFWQLLIFICSLLESMKTLFWALFGLSEIENLSLESGLHLTESWVILCMHSICW